MLALGGLVLPVDINQRKVGAGSFVVSILDNKTVAETKRSPPSPILGDDCQTRICFRWVRLRKPNAERKCLAAHWHRL